MRKRRSKSLERLAREIRDEDVFVEHVFNIAAAYRANHALDAGPRLRELRQSLKTFHRHAAALAAALEEAQKERGASIERDAFQRLLSHFPEGTVAARQQSFAVRQWLEHATRASQTALESLRGANLQEAPRQAAEAIRATFEHHRLKVSSQASAAKQSDAVRLLCAIAKDSGCELSLNEARQAFAKPGPARGS